MCSFLSCRRLWSCFSQLHFYFSAASVSADFGPSIISWRDLFCSISSVFASVSPVCVRCSRHTELLSFLLCVWKPRCQVSVHLLLTQLSVSSWSCCIMFHIRELQIKPMFDPLIWTFRHHLVEYVTITPTTQAGMKSSICRRERIDGFRPGGGL